MNRITSTAVRFLSFVMLAAVCLHTVPAFAATLTTTDADNACSNTDLLQTQFESFSYTGSKSTLTEPTVRDGVALTSTEYGTSHFQAWTGEIWTYTLDTSVNTLGYDLSQVNVYHGWVNDGRDGLRIKVEFSKVDTPDTFVLLYDMGAPRYDPPSDYGKISITAAPADGATGVKRVRITITDPEAGQTGVSEIDVLGTAPPPIMTGSVLIVR